MKDANYSTTNEAALCVVLHLKIIVHRARCCSFKCFKFVILKRRFLFLYLVSSACVHCGTIERLSELCISRLYKSLTTHVSCLVCCSEVTNPVNALDNVTGDPFM